MTIEHQHDPVGTTYTKPFRDLDIRRLPSAPPRPGACEQLMAVGAPSGVLNMKKTKRLIEHLRTHATSPDQALTPRQLSSAIGQEIESTAPHISALLSSVHHCYEQLRSIKHGNTNAWWWSEPAAAHTEEPIPQDPEQDDPIIASLRRTTSFGEIPNRTLHAARLRAIADLPIIETSVALWLEELALWIEDAA